MSTDAIAHHLPATERAPRWAMLAGPALGVASVVGMAIAIPAGEDQPDAQASATEAVAYWSAHSGKQLAAAAILALVAAALICFGTVLRSALTRAGAVADLAFGAMLVGAAGLLTNVGLAVATAETAGDVSPQATQTLSSLNIEFAAPMAVGFGLMMMASGVAAAQSRLLPRWAGALAVAFGVFGLTPLGEPTFWTFPVWILALSVALFVRRDAQR
jgi:hypothetical protein